MKSKVIVAPNYDKEENDNNLKIFLGGTIDDGNSFDWQKSICEWITENDFNITVYNPRRESWNPNATEDELKEQINWELDHMNKADCIIMNILAFSKSPISLMEIGLHSQDKNLKVFCPKEFYRYKNVETVCEKYNIPHFKTNELHQLTFAIFGELYNFNESLKNK